MAKITLFAQVIQGLPKELIKSVVKKHAHRINQQVQLFAKLYIMLIKTHQTLKGQQSFPLPFSHTSITPLIQYTFVQCAIHICTVNCTNVYNTGSV